VDAVITRRKALARFKRATHWKWVMLMPMPSRQNAPGNLLNCTLQAARFKPLDGIHNDLPKPPRTHLHWMV